MLRTGLDRARSDKGASALTIAITMVVITGMAAIAIDAGAGFIERRQDQTAGDVGAMAGILDFSSGEISVRDQVLAFVPDNVEGSGLSPADWQAAWESCTDPNKNDGGFDFDPVSAPAGWAVSEIDCINIDDAGFVRVRVPDQAIDTSFGALFGLDNLFTHAAAISRTVTHAQGDILPFAVLGGATQIHYCLRSDAGGPGGGGGGPPGAVADPCDGPDTGHFGTIDSPLVGNTVLDTDEHCTNLAQFRILATNIALGLDHPVYKNESYPGGTVEDQCGNIGINALNTDEGMGQGTEQGLFNGSSSDFHSPNAEPLLQQSHATRHVNGEMLNDKPLWEFLLPDGSGRDGNSDSVPDSPVWYSGPMANAPVICDPMTFDGGSYDWDGDGTDDENRSWKHMKACLEAYVMANNTVQMFAAGDEIQSGGGSVGIDSVSTSSRFNYVPQFHETAFPPGNCCYSNIDIFRAVYIQGIWFGSGAGQEDFHPGEAYSESYNGNLRQVSGFLFPDDALPVELRGDPPPIGEATNTVSLFR